MYFDESHFRLRRSHFQRQQLKYYVSASWVLYSIGVTTVRDTIILLVRGKGSPPRTDDLFTRPPAVAKKNTNGTLVVWLKW